MFGLNEITNDLMIVDLVHFDLIQRSEYLNVFIKYLIFLNSSHGWRVMLLEAHNHMAYQWALRWQESSTRLKSHCMPHFTVLETIFLEIVVSLHIFHATLL